MRGDAEISSTGIGIQHVPDVMMQIFTFLKLKPLVNLRIVHRAWWQAIKSTLGVESIEDDAQAMAAIAIAIRGRVTLFSIQRNFFRWTLYKNGIITFSPGILSFENRLKCLLKNNNLATFKRENVRDCTPKWHALFDPIFKEGCCDDALSKYYKFYLLLSSLLVGPIAVIAVIFSYTDRCYYRCRRVKDDRCRFMDDRCRFKDGYIFLVSLAGAVSIFFLLSCFPAICICAYRYINQHEPTTPLVFFVRVCAAYFRTLLHPPYLFFKHVALACVNLIRNLCLLLQGPDVTDEIKRELKFSSAANFFFRLPNDKNPLNRRLEPSVEMV